MFETLMGLFNSGKGPLTTPMLANAVIKKWITDTQKKEILATKK